MWQLCLKILIDMSSTYFVAGWSYEELLEYCSVCSVGWKKILDLFPLILIYLWPSGYSAEKLSEGKEKRTTTTTKKKRIWKWMKMFFPTNFQSCRLHSQRQLGFMGFVRVRRAETSVFLPVFANDIVWSSASLLLHISISASEKND